jgi:hypothetical protein
MGQFLDLLEAYHNELGYDPPSWGKERSGAKRLVTGEYTIDDMLRCYRHFKAEKFWQRKHVSLTYIAQQIGAWKAAQTKNTSDKELEKWYRENN